jgi:GTP-binding protein
MADLSQINSEMALFDTSLAKKNQVVVVNKMDLPEVVEQWPALEKALKKLGHKPMLISAMERQGLEPLKWRIMEELENAPAPEPITALPVYKPEEDPREYSINRKDDGWQVRGAAIERAAAMTYWEHDGSVRRFQRLMETIGLDKELRELGIQNGDTVFIGKDYELEWQD